MSAEVKRSGRPLPPLPNNAVAQLTGQVKKLAEEEKRLKKLVDKYEAMPKPPSMRPKNNAQKVIQAAHVKQKSFKERGKDLVRAGLEAATRFIREKGLETLITLGTALLTSDEIRQQPGNTDTIVAAGTVLCSIDLYPNFADEINPGSHSRLSRISSTFMRYKFVGNSCVNFVPSAGALANGQIGMFITSDPRYEITGTGQEVVRLVHEFNGTVSQISQPMCLPVPRKDGDWLYVEDAHESDIRFTRQGTLWVVAFTDIDITSVGASLGEMRLDYEIALRDNSIDGVVITNPNHQPTHVYVGTASNITLSAVTLTSWNLVFGGTSVSTGPVTIPINVSGYNLGTIAPLYTNDPEGVIVVNQLANGSTVQFNQLGVYKLEFGLSVAANLTSVTASATAGNTYGVYYHLDDWDFNTSSATEIEHFGGNITQWVNNTSTYAMNSSTAVNVTFYYSPSVAGEVHCYYLTAQLAAGSLTAGAIGFNQITTFAITQLSQATPSVFTNAARGFHVVEKKADKKPLLAGIVEEFEANVSPKIATPVDGQVKNRRL